MPRFSFNYEAKKYKEFSTINFDILKITSDRYVRLREERRNILRLLQWYVNMSLKNTAVSIQFDVVISCTIFPR